MARVIPIGEPVNEAERRAIRHLRDRLPDGYLLVHNFEIVRGGELFEVDLAVIAPHAVYLVDVKGTRGLIDVYGPKWHPDGRQPYTSPLIKLRAHARSLKGIITDSQRGRRDLEGVYVDAVVLLASPGAVLQDPSGRDAPSVTTLLKAPGLFQNAARIGGRFSKNISILHSMVLKALQGVARPRTGPLRFGNWEVEERLGGTDAYTEYRGFNTFAGKRSGRILLRVYKADPYLTDPGEIAQQRARIANAYNALNQMPGHPAIVGVRDFAPVDEHEDRFVLVTEDVRGQALRVHIDKANLALTLDQKLRVASELLGALAHAHQHDVVHRNLTPSTILIGTDERVRLIGFDFARAGTDRSRTIAHEIVDELEPLYTAPEAFREPQKASAASDVFSAGLVLYELFTGDKPFASPTEVFDQGGVFSVKPSEHRPELATPRGGDGNASESGQASAFDNWLQRLCAFDPDRRPTAGKAATELATLLAAEASAENEPTAPEPETEPRPEVDYSQLAPGTHLTHKYLVDRRLGRPGSFGVVYKVIDTLGDVSRAMKLILRDRHSTLDRLKKEYRTLLRVPEHPNVVKVIDADLLPRGGPPFIVFEYIEGLDVGEMVEGGLFAPEDALELARQVAEGLAHLHRHGVYHCDIKPRNLIWTDRGVRIIDFNVSVLAAADNGRGGGSRRYLPPDIDLNAVPRPSDLADRDLYALGVTLYEAITGAYPWLAATPPPGEPPLDPRSISGLSDLAPELAEVAVKAIAPKRADRFASIAELQASLAGVQQARRARSETTETWATVGLDDGGSTPPNTNPFVARLLTLYSQSQQSNVGTRGLDALGERTYVETALDRQLEPAVLRGEFRLVLITGNAGDGKTAFLQRLEQRAHGNQAAFDPPLVNGRRFRLQDRTYLTNYDGSQDEGDQKSDEVLGDFFAPFAGADADAWPDDEVRLIAINEGRLVDFLTTERERFPLLERVVRVGLVSGTPEHRVAVVNLNLRSVVTATGGLELFEGDPKGGDESIFARLIRRLTHEAFWEPCNSCDLKERCYVLHNARTFQDETAGHKVIERLKTLYAITHLRGRLHITMRDLRSAVAYMLAGTRDCQAIHDLYKAGDRAAVVQGFYFNSWMGGDTANADRLLALLQEVDVGHVSDPRFDRAIDFVSPVVDRSLFRFARRADYDREVIQRLFDDLPRDYSGRPTEHRLGAHQGYVEMVRRRAFFERRDSGWRQMLPYRSAEQMLGLVRGEAPLHEVLPRILRAINRGEGLSDPGRLDGRLALRVREVERGTVRSYRVFPPERFSLAISDSAGSALFIEHMPIGLVLRYRGEAGNEAEIQINLDVFEMLERVGEGYRPSIEEEQGHYLSLAVFKNLLGSEPYQEVLLTTTGHDFYRIERHGDGRLEMKALGPVDTAPVALPADVV